MFKIRIATIEDIDFWVTQDRHIAKDNLIRKIEHGQCYIIQDDETCIGVLRYGLFWDVVPFLNLIHFLEEYRGKGFGSLAMDFWEEKMRTLNHKIVMTSTQADEGAQHFYRKLGYKDSGCIILDIPPYAQPLELIMIKQL